MTKTLARDPARRCMPLAEWPAQDRALWLASLRPGDIVDPDGARAALSPRSNRKVEAGFGRWLQWLLFNGHLDPSVPPGERITPERVNAYDAELAQYNSTRTRICRLIELFSAARVMAPDEDWSWISRAAGRLRAINVPVRAKRSRVVETRVLYDLGIRLMTTAETEGTPRQAAMQYRDGLIIALLASDPVRRRNLAGLEIGRTIQKIGEAWWLVIPAEETKGKTPIDMPLPAALSPLLEAYIAAHRPLLTCCRSRWWRDPGNALWVSSHGSPMTEMAIYDRVAKLTRSELGRTVSLHDFRTSAVTTIAVEAPAQIGAATALLTHSAPRTTQRYYNMATAREAVAQLQSVVAELRAAYGAGDPDADVVGD